MEYPKCPLCKSVLEPAAEYNDVSGHYSLVWICDCFLKNYNDTEELEEYVNEKSDKSLTLKENP
jgi:hypothetical protein